MSSRQQQKAEARAAREERERVQLRAQHRAARSCAGSGSVARRSRRSSSLVLRPRQPGVARTSRTRARARPSRAIADAQRDARRDPAARDVAWRSEGAARAHGVRRSAVPVLPRLHPRRAARRSIQRYVRTKKLRLEIRLRRLPRPGLRRGGACRERGRHARPALELRRRLLPQPGRGELGLRHGPLPLAARDGRGRTGELVRRRKHVGGVRRSRSRSPSATAVAAGQTSTPSFLIGPKAGQGKPLNVAGLDFASFTPALDAALAR